MELKFLRIFSLTAGNIENLWDFSGNNAVCINMVGKREFKTMDAFERTEKTRYIFQGYMTDEAYFALTLSIAGIQNESQL